MLIFKKCSRKLKFRFARNAVESIGLFNNDVFALSYAFKNLLYSTILKSIKEKWDSGNKQGKNQLHIDPPNPYEENLEGSYIPSRILNVIQP